MVEVVQQGPVLEVTQIKEALFLTLPGTHNAHQPGMFTTY